VTGKPQHQGSLVDQLAELAQIANQNGLYDAADAVIRSREMIEQIAAYFDEQAAKESDLQRLPAVRPDSKKRIQERWMVYKASAQAVRDGQWRKRREPTEGP